MDGWTDGRKKRGWLFASSVQQELSPSQSISYMHLVPSKQTDRYPKAEISSSILHLATSQFTISQVMCIKILKQYSAHLDPKIPKGVICTLVLFIP